MPKHIAPEKKEEAVRLYQEGYSSIVIAKQLGMNVSTVCKTLKEHGIQVRSNKINSRRYFVDDNYFEEITDEHKAYWYGFIYADGVIQNPNIIRVDLKAIDRQHLQKLTNAVKSTYPVYTYMYGEKEVARFCIRSDKMFADLTAKHVIPNKTFHKVFPKDVIPPELYKHFIRGYFDGNGSLTFHDVTRKSGIKYRSYKFTINSSLELLEGIAYVIRRNTGLRMYYDKRWKTRDNNSYSIEVAGNLQVLTVCNFLYNDATVYLDRKYQRYLQLKEMYNPQNTASTHALCRS